MNLRTNVGKFSKNFNPPKILIIPLDQRSPKIGMSCLILILHDFRLFDCIIRKTKYSFEEVWVDAWNPIESSKKILRFFFFYMI